MISFKCNNKIGLIEMKLKKLKIKKNPRERTNLIFLSLGKILRKRKNGERCGKLSSFLSLKIR